MTRDELYKELQGVNHSREKRHECSTLIMENTYLIPKLLDIMFMVDDNVSPKAGWVMEFLCNRDVNFIIDHLNQFTENIHRVHQDSAVRPVAKLCELIAIAYSSNENTQMKKALRPTYKERIIETCFDYMINDEKIAPKAYAMNTLFLLGKETDWIHPELTLIIERDYKMQSSGFKARARHILKKIKKDNHL